MFVQVNLCPWKLFNIFVSCAKQNQGQYGKYDRNPVFRGEFLLRKKNCQEYCDHET